MLVDAQNISLSIPESFSSLQRFLFLKPSHARAVNFPLKQTTMKLAMESRETNGF